MLRDDKLHLAGFFSAHLRKHQVTWLPCEVEALAIATVVNHFVPYILQANQCTHVLTGSRPCVLEYQKLCCGEFSSSTCVTAFLSTVSRFQLTIDHLVGAANLPSDFASPNPLSCPDGQCQTFRRHLSVQWQCRMLSRVSYLCHSPVTQHGYRPNKIALILRRVHAHLKQGTRPQKKVTNIPDVKRYLRQVTTGYLECIVVPRQVLVGLITVIHIKFNLPSPYQTKQLTNRYFCI